jgi:toxin CcdB
MRQFDLYRNPQPRTAAVAPYLLALSSHLLPNVNIVIVAPLLRDRRRPMQDVEPALVVEGETLVLGLTDLFSVEIRDLKSPVANLIEAEDAIRRALDRLFTGF